jgi:hypothetical protein
MIKRSKDPSLAQSAEAASAPLTKWSKIPDPRDVPRGEILLPRVAPETIALAQRLAAEIKEHLTVASGSAQKLPRRMQVAAFMQLTKEISDKLQIDLEHRENYQEILTLCAYLCSRPDNMRGSPLLIGLPIGLIEDSSLSDTPRAVALMRYFITETIGMRTAKDVENFAQWSKTLAKHGFGTLKGFQIPDLVGRAYPGFQEGDVPAIREWKLPQTNKWSFDEQHRLTTLTRAKRAFRSVLFEVGALKRDGSLDVERLLTTKWGLTFSDPQYGLRGIIHKKSPISNSLRALRIAIPRVIGLKQGQISPYQLRYMAAPESREEALREIHKLTRYLVEVKLKLTTKDSHPSPSKIAAIPNWGYIYDSHASECFSWGVVKNAAEALQVTYPQLFGWSKNQIAPGQVSWAGMWQGVAGRELFARRFAHAINNFYCKHVDQRGLKFNPNGHPILKLDISESLALQSALSTQRLSWGGLITANCLDAGLRKAYSGKLSEVFKDILDRKDGSPAPDLDALGLSDLKRKITTERRMLGLALSKVARQGKDSNVEPHSNTAGLIDSQRLLARFCAPHIDLAERRLARSIYRFTLAALRGEPPEKNPKPRFNLLRSVLSAQFVSGPHAGNKIASSGDIASVLRFIANNETVALGLSRNEHNHLKKLIVDLNSRRDKLTRPALRSALAVAQNIDRKDHPLQYLENITGAIIKYLSSPAHLGIPKMIARVLPREDRGLTPNPADFGLGELQAPPSHRFNNWATQLSPEQANQKVALVIRMLVEDRLGLAEANGAVSAAKLLSVTNWSDELRKFSPRCLSWGGVKTIEGALQLAYPQLFGWKAGLIKPGEIVSQGMWRHQSGRELLGKRLAFALAEFYSTHIGDRGPQFNPDAPPYLSISVRQAIEIRSAMANMRIGLVELVKQAGLTNAVRELCKSRTELALELAIDSSPPKVTSYSSKATIIKVLRGGYRSLLVINLLSSLLKSRPHIKWPEHVYFNPYLDKVPANELGVEGTPFNRLCQPQPARADRPLAIALYKASINAAKLGIESYLGRPESALELILNGRINSGSDSKQYVLSDSELKRLFTFIKDEALDCLSLNQQHKQMIIEFISQFRGERYRILRPVLLKAINLQKKSGENDNLLELLNMAVNTILSVITNTEARRARLIGETTPLFERLNDDALDSQAG